MPDMSEFISPDASPDATPDATPVTQPPRPCTRCATPTEKRRYVIVSHDPTAKRGLWCAACVNAKSTRCRATGAVVDTAVALYVTIDTYGSRSTYSPQAADDAVTAGSIVWVAPSSGGAQLCVRSIVHVVVDDVVNAPSSVRYSLSVSGLWPCSGHASRHGTDPTRENWVSQVTPVDDGDHSVCAACLPMLARCQICSSPYVGHASVLANTPHPRLAVCRTCAATHDRDRSRRVGPVNVGSYHSTGNQGYRPVGASSISQRPTVNGVSSDVMRLGVELEMVTANPSAAATAVRDQLGNMWAGAERDASVSGVECPTQPATIDEHRRIWPNFRAPSGTTVDRTCGLHVHMTRKAMSRGQVARISYLLNHHVDAAHWDTFFRRPAGNYCLRRTHGIAWHAIGGNNERYSVVNLTPSRTIEIRQPAGSLRGDTILATVEMLWCVYLYTLPGNPGSCYTRSAGLSWEGLIKWLCSDPMARSESRNARKYLVKRGLLPQPKKGADTDDDDGEGDIPPDGAGRYVPAPAPINWDTLHYYTTA